MKFQNMDMQRKSFMNSVRAKTPTEKVYYTETPPV